MISPLAPRDALARLKEGNRRFLGRGRTIQKRGFSAELAEVQQRPLAVVLGCSDSRTPVEILFDQGFGDLFVVRVAGHVVAPSVVGSIEFAAQQFGTRLVVVLGHTRCGAIKATVEALRGNNHASRNIRDITDRIRPYIESVVSVSDYHTSQGHRPADAARSSREDTELVRASMRAQVRASAEHLRHGSRVLEDLVLDGTLAIVGAEYELETGKVRFFHGLPLEREEPRMERSPQLSLAPPGAGFR